MHRAIPVTWCPCAGFFDHAHVSMPDKFEQTNPGSTWERKTHYTPSTSLVIRRSWFQSREKEVESIQSRCFQKVHPIIVSRVSCLLAPLRIALLSESWSSWRGLRPHSNPSQYRGSRPLKRIPYGIHKSQNIHCDVLRGSELFSWSFEGVVFQCKLCI